MSHIRVKVLTVLQYKPADHDLSATRGTTIRERGYKVGNMCSLYSQKQ